MWEDRTIVSLGLDVALDGLALRSAAVSDDRGSASGQRAVILEQAQGRRS